MEMNKPFRKSANGLFHSVLFYFTKEILFYYDRQTLLKTKILLVVDPYLTITVRFKQIYLITK